MKAQFSYCSLLVSSTCCLLAAAPLAAQSAPFRVEIKSNQSLAQLGATFMEDCWGYVSQSGREYAILGLSQGTGFVEVTDPSNPSIISIKLQPVNGRDMKVYQDYVYSSVDSGPTFIYDVSDIDNGVVTTVGSFNAGAHNLIVDEVSGFLYLAVGGPLNIYSLSNPEAPVFVGQWPGETHDAQVVTYTSGPNAGRQIAFVFSGRSDNLDIIDVTDKSNIFLVGRTTYPNAAYVHEGWLSKDQNYMYVSDELDNINRTTIIDRQRSI